MVDRAKYDVNLNPSLIAASNGDGVTPVSLWADPTTHGIIISAGTGSLVVSPVTFTTTVDTNVAGSATSVQVLAANTVRKEATIYNDSTSACYIKEGTTASATDYKYKLYQGDVYKTNNYTGRIDALWDTATGSARVSES